MILWSLVIVSFAERPTEGGQFAFDVTDEVAFYEEGAVRVHYSVLGPNQTILEDLDGSGVPDFVETTAVTANDVLDFYASIGFVYPLTEDAVGLADLGGSNAFDFYLVDFGGNADGMFGVDGCQGTVCAGHMVMENDFVGYGYPSLAEAIDVLTSHELFHAVQAAYNATQPSWLSEGTAVWAEWAYNPEVRDFLSFSSAYLSETERSLHRPPAGMTTAFSYGTGLFFAFWDEHYAEEISRVVTLQESLYGIDESEMILAVLEQMDDVETDWMTFSKWNLATNVRTGEIDGYSFASRLWGLESEIRGPVIEDDYRFYPLASTFFELEHPGGECHFFYEGTDEDVQFSLHPVNESERVENSIREWKIGDDPHWTMELSEGQYWLIGALPMLTDNSQKIDFCLGRDCQKNIDVPEETINKQGCQTMNVSYFFWWVSVLPYIVRRRSV